MVEIGEPYETSFITLYALSYIFLVLALLSGYALMAPELQAYGSVYLAMLTLSLAFMRGMKPPERLGEGLVLGLAALFTISSLSQIIRDAWQSIGVLHIQLQPQTPPATPGLTPSLILTLLMNIPSPVAEECFFRISLFHLLKTQMGETWATITQAAIFGIYHYYAYQMDTLGILTATIAGLALGLIYLKTRSQTAISLSHIIYNQAVVLIGGA